MSIFFSFLFSVIFNDIHLLLISLVVVMAFRAILCEYTLSRNKFRANSLKQNTYELSFASLFILMISYLQSSTSLLIYVVCLIGFLVVEFKNIKNSIINLLRLI